MTDTPRKHPERYEWQLLRFGRLVDVLKERLDSKCPCCLGGKTVTFTPEDDVRVSVRRKKYKHDYWLYVEVSVKREDHNDDERWFDSARFIVSHELKLKEFIEKRKIFQNNYTFLAREAVFAAIPGLKLEV